MAYTTNTLSYLGGGLVEGAWKEWAYVTADSIQTVLGAGYIADAALATGGKGMGVGDIVYVINQSLPGAFTLQVAAISGGAATLGVPPNAPGESTIFGGSAQGTSPPGRPPTSGPASASSSTRSKPRRRRPSGSSGSRRRSTGSREALRRSRRW
jgi:hypothetical protein